MDAPEQPHDTEAPQERTQRPRRRWGRAFLLALFTVGLVVGGIGTALVKSDRGQRLVLDAVLSRVRGALAGELVVDGIHSRNLLGGVTLLGVHMSAAAGRPAVTADSLQVRYSLLSLIRHAPRIRSLTVWGPVVRIMHLAGDTDTNVAQLQAPDSSAADSLASPLGLALASVRVVGGTVEVLSPVGGDVSQDVPTVPSPDGKGRLRRLALDSLSLELRDVVLTPSAGRKLAGRLASLSAKVSVLDRPIRVVDARGGVTAGDAGFHLGDAQIKLPGSTLGGTLALGPRSGDSGPWGFTMDVRTEGGASLSDFDWLDPRIPRGTLSGRIGVTAFNSTDVELRKVRVELEASQLDVDGGVTVDDGGLQLRTLSVDARPLVLGRLEPWIGRTLPLDGWLSGHATFSGRLDTLAASGRVTLVPVGHGGAPTTLAFDGTLHLAGSDPGVTKLTADLDPLSFDVLDVLQPKLAVHGAGRATVQGTGRVDEGLRFTANIVHMGDSLPDSRVALGGSVRRSSTQNNWNLDVRGDLSPLSLALVEGAAPSLDLRGAASGSLRVRGPVSALHVTGDLHVAQGTLGLDGTVNARDPAQGYRLSAKLEDVRASEVVGVLPDPSVMSGRLTLDGRGVTLDSLRARGSLVAVASRVGGLHVDSVTALLSAADGQLTVDTLDADVGGMRVWGSGGLGLVAGSAGEARLMFHTDSLLGLRSVFLGDSVRTRDGLSSLELEFLRMQGVNPDTLPTKAEVAMSGSLDGSVTLSGSLPALDVEGSASVRKGVFGTDSVGEGDIGFWARRALSTDRELHATVDVKQVDALGRDYTHIRADADLKGRTGRASADVERDASERYVAAGEFTLGHGAGSVRVDTLTLHLDSLTWRNRRPVRLAWDSVGITVHDLDIERPGNDPMHLTAEGTLAWQGDSDFQVEARGLHLERVGRIAQREDLALGGRLDLGLRLTGPAASPLIDGSFEVREPRFEDLALARVAGEVHYRDRLAQVRLDADEQGRRVLDVQGSVPVNLALRETGSRVGSSPMDVRVRADSLDASVALRYLTSLQNVTGTVSGDFHIGGTLDTPEPSGVLRLTRAGWNIAALGVRHSDVEGTLTLKPDRTVQVALTGHTRDGSSTVNGTVTLAPVRNPALDLKIDFHNFEAVNRSDVNGSLSGEVHLGGTYRLPFVQGDLTVDHSNLFVEEFARSADVVDLTDPRIFDVVDTTSLEERPLLAAIRNPFMDNLRVEVNLSVPRDSWLRSEDMNVEIGGKLLVRYDRSRRDIVMVGQLQALRGSYSVLGRRFEVQQGGGGTVDFIGTPGINPTLDIQAVAQVRRVDADPLSVTATVSGDLAQPRVTLSSDEQGVSQSDLISYLVFGRPSSEFATGQSKFAQGAAGSILGAAANAGVTYLSGTVATHLGSALSRQIGFIDYLSVNQSGGYGVASGSLAGSALTDTEVEFGKYWGNKVFFILIFRPRPQPSQNHFAGARAEVALSGNYNVQGYWEDRFLQSGVTGFGDLARQASRVIGVFIFRSWGY
ncbi:MAG: translocation/assembly module TamB domain-containing protein [Gemmatimonadetes bacterium]|nr:translocation/assembly module TamB domain-containing protein [Gemmatimonadota bacterium]